jgi:amino acid adenylation domain-containing protein
VSVRAPVTPVLHQLLDRAADVAPGQLAVVDGHHAITYGQLAARANRLARMLVELGVGRGDRVALYLDKSVASVVGVYGVMKAGASYVPLDPNAPASRLGAVARACGARHLLSATAKAAAWSELHHHGAAFEHVIVLDDGDDSNSTSGNGLGTADGEHTLHTGGDAAGWLHPSAEIDQQPSTPPDVRTIDADLAYLLYTSGSTGVPKGVMLSHRNALAFVDWAVRTFEVHDEDRLSSHAPLHFDLSIFDLYAAAMATATMVMVPPRASVFPREAVRFMADQRISVWYSVPSILSMIVLRGGLEPGILPTLRTILFAGEVFPTKYLRTLMHALPHVRFANLYGPTETNVCTWYEVTDPPEGDEGIPIGRAIDGDETIVVDPDGRPVAPGTPGDLYVRGATVMQGYWGDDERTADTLISNPWLPQLGDPVYRTGDLVCELPDGNLRFLGRRDAQIKSRGYRIELGDIESALHAHPEVVECAAVAVPDELVTNRIHAHVVTRSDGIELIELAQHCADRLPAYMIPESFALHDALPRTSTGKLDRRALQSDAATAS